MRQTSLGALAAGLLGGVSEPSLYGIHLRYKMVYKRMLVGCATGGVVIAILGWLFPSTVASGQVVHGVTTTAFAFTSLLTIPVFNQMWVYGVSIAAAFIVSFLMVAMFDYRTPEQKAEAKQRAADYAAEKAAAKGKSADAPAAVEAAPAAETGTKTAVETTTVGISAVRPYRVPRRVRRSGVRFPCPGRRSRHSADRFHRGGTGVRRAVHRGRNRPCLRHQNR